MFSPVLTVLSVGCAVHVLREAQSQKEALCHNDHHFQPLQLLVLLPVEKLQKPKTSNSKHGARATLVTEHASTDAGLLLHCSDDDDWTPGYPEAVLVHHFAGSWKNDDQQPHTALQAAVQGPVPEEGPLYR